MVVVMEMFVLFVFGGGELYFVKLVCYNDCGVEVEENVEFFNNMSKYGGGLGLIEDIVGEGNSSKEV